MRLINRIIADFKQIRPLTWIIVAILLVAIIAIAPSALKG